MTWVYEIRSGKLFDGSVVVAIGYSGDQLHKNDVEAVSLPNQGPIPPGRYFTDPPVDTVTHGPYVLPLTPDPGNEMYGRSGFLIHGDSVVAPGTASEGCIILPRNIRELIWNSGDRVVDVVAQIPDDTFTGA